QRPVHEGRARGCSGGSLQRHPGLERQFPRRLDRASLRERPAFHDRALDRDPDHRDPDAARCRAPARQSARHLRPCYFLVAGDEPMTRTFPRNSGIPAFREPAFAALLLSATMLAGCATNRTPQFSYDADVPVLPTAQAVATDDRPRPLHTPPAWTVARGGTSASTPDGRVATANAAARVQPRRDG